MQVFAAQWGVPWKEQGRKERDIWKWVSILLLVSSSPTMSIPAGKVARSLRMGHHVFLPSGVLVGLTRLAKAIDEPHLWLKPKAL